MSTRYYVPADRHHPIIPLGLAWMLWLTSKHVAWPGWVWGVVWTLYVILLVATVIHTFTATAYSKAKMDRILGGD